MNRSNPKVRVEDQDGQERDQRQYGQADLQKFIKGKTEQIKPDIDPEERIGQPKGSAITKAEIRIPLCIEEGRKVYGGDSSDRGHNQLQDGGRDLNADCRSNGGLACQTTRTESATFLAAARRLIQRYRNATTKAPQNSSHLRARSVQKTPL